MSSKPDYYVVLGVERGSDETVIKKAYRSLALKYHPDRNPGDVEAEERFKEAAEAYEVLSNPQKRQLYDQYGHEGLGGQSFGGFNNFGDIFSAFGDIFGDIFGQSKPRGGPKRGRDLGVEQVVDFREAYNGCEKLVKVPRMEKCEDCAGTGSKSKIVQVCPKCHGEGQVMTSMSFIRMASVCPQCRGTGEFPSDPCPSCRGAGKVTRHKEISVRIPAGVDTGARLRVRGEGEAGDQGGPRGDLYVDIAVRHSDLFSRERNHVVYETKIDVVLAALGGDLEVPTVDGGTRDVSVPAGAQNGKLLRVPGLGFPSLSTGARGDFIVVLAVATPVNLTDRQRELLEEFGAIENEKKSENTLDRWARKLTSKVKKVLQS
ncbi:MAG: molecular chaperone DnaJ [Deltaproteobacteria bacterium]|jgi:molecular chaperone DnaJ|nr:molecular chaperone DnaJ [Deltaproteobacteria bacterium]